jgi:hypothetical protein
MAVLGATNLTGCNSIPDFIAGGSIALFFNTSAPTSWTKQTTQNNKALRVVSGNGGGSGGSTAFTSVFASRTVPNHTLVTGQLAFHTHKPLDAAVVQSWGVVGGSSAFCAAIGGAVTVNNIGSTGANGSSLSHGHGSLDFAVQYIDLIICSKN